NGETLLEIIMNKTTSQAPAKNMAVGLLLTFLFGPLGLFYVSVVGGIILTLLAIIITIIGVLTFGFGFFFLPVIWVVSIVWAAVAIDRANK
ncbi:MAG: hypothetical protein K0041_09380, partial [Acidithiobacillus sp.]|nr:hypothetical protein [Acidithiobacillus sp.]